MIEMTVPVIQIGPATLFHGDALKILPSLDPVDLIVTDPPYKLTYGGAWLAIYINPFGFRQYLFG